jgi:DNA-binding response OmpR family regulator
MDRTIDVHITNLRRKIEATGKQHYVVTVHGVGYRLGDVR